MKVRVRVFNNCLANSINNTFCEARTNVVAKDFWPGFQTVIADFDAKDLLKMEHMKNFKPVKLQAQIASCDRK